MALIVDMMVQKFSTYYLKDPEWYNVSFPSFWHPARGIFLSTTIFMVVAVSAERFRAICYPFTKRQVSINTRLLLRNHQKKNIYK